MGRFLAALAAVVLFASATDARAHEYKEGTLVIEHPVLLEPSQDADKAVGTLTIRNVGTDGDRLIDIDAPALSEIVEIHIVPNDAAANRQVVTTLDIPARQDTVLTPTGNHILFSKLKERPVVDYAFPVILTFEKAGPIETMFQVEGPLAEGH